MSRDGKKSWEQPFSVFPFNCLERRTEEEEEEEMTLVVWSRPPPPFISPILLLSVHSLFGEGGVKNCPVAFAAIIFAPRVAEGDVSIGMQIATGRLEVFEYFLSLYNHKSLKIGGLINQNNLRWRVTWVG